MKKIYLLFAGVLSLTQPVEAQQKPCPAGKPSYDQTTQCCEWSDPIKRITSVIVEIKNPSSKNEPISLPLQDPKCSQFYFAQEGDWIPYSYESANGGPPETGGPWTVSLKSEKHSGLCPGSIVVVEAVKSSDCFSGGWQLGYITNLQEPKSNEHKNPTLYIEAPATKEEDLAAIPEPQAPTD